jgi:hypothetical protein
MVVKSDAVYCKLLERPFTLALFEFLCCMHTADDVRAI